MRVLYFDPIGGVSGDMMLAALIDLGVKRESLKKYLSFVPGSEIKIGRVNRKGVSARTVKFVIKKQIREKQFIPLIKKSNLPGKVKSQAITIIERIFAAEKKVHHTKQLHLHELADADTLLDIAGVLVAIDSLGADRIFSKPAKAGSGFTRTIEGDMPAFNFATAELLKGFPVEFLPIPAELTTPTGAALLSSIAAPAENLVMSRIIKVGLGAGHRNLAECSNVLRVFLGESSDHLTDECTLIETNIDDMNPQDYELLSETLYSAGALDVFLTPTIMKRSRPGILLTVICREPLDQILDILFVHTTSIGFRVNRVKRLKFKREIRKLTTPYGRVGVKIIEYGNKHRYSFEYRDLKRIAQAKGRSINELRTALMQLYGKKLVKYIK